MTEKLILRLLERILQNQQKILGALKVARSQNDEPLLKEVNDALCYVGGPARWGNSR